MWVPWKRKYCICVDFVFEKKLFGLFGPHCSLGQPRDYTQDLDAILVAKPSRFTIEMTAMWQDHVGKALLKPSGSGLQEDVNAAVDEAEEQLHINISVLFVFASHVFVCLCYLSFMFLRRCRKICAVPSMQLSLPTSRMTTKRP